MEVPRELVEAMLSRDPDQKYGLYRIADELTQRGLVGMGNVLRGYADQLEVLSQEKVSHDDPA